LLLAVIAQDHTHTEKTNYLFWPQSCYPSYNSDMWLILVCFPGLEILRTEEVLSSVPVVKRNCYNCISKFN